MSDYSPEVGDRVRITIEGVVVRNHLNPSDRFELENGRGFSGKPRDVDVVSIEQVQPTTHVFQPGEVIRGKATGWTITVGKGGYLAHDDGEWHQSWVWFTGDQFEPLHPETPEEHTP
jgi:hypothetical protein